MSRSAICPTITAVSPAQYQQQMDKVERLARRLHIDIADGQLAPRQLMAPDALWWPGGHVIDIHAMYQRPFDLLELFIVQHPHLVIVHAEADGDFVQFAHELRRHGIKVGVALLPRTPASLLAPALPLIDHVLIFSGNLGYQGGSSADFSLLDKVRQLRAHKPALEIGWDGGINNTNIRYLSAAGIDVLNVGGYLQRAADPYRAYATLEALV